MEGLHAILELVILLTPRKARAIERAFVGTPLATQHLPRVGHVTPGQD